MTEKIGYNDGITGFVAYMRKIPGVKYRIPENRPATLPEWYWLEKIERTFRILKDAHDAGVPYNGGPTPPNPPDPAPPTTYKKVAPRVAYKAGGSDARFCCVNQPGVVRSGSGWKDDVASYDDNGLCTSGTRSDGPAMTSALEIDGRDYCSLPTTGDPKKNTGSWEI